MTLLTEAEIRELVKGLSSATGEKRHADMKIILAKLQSGVRPTEEIIRATKVGQAVAKLRTCEDKSVAALSKDIVRTWRSKVDSQRTAVKNKDSSSNSASPATGGAQSPATPSSSTMGAGVAPSTSVSPMKKKEALDWNKLGDKTRNACLKFLYDSLEIGSSTDPHLIFERALAVEGATFKKVGSGTINGDYRTKIRSLGMNLKDKKNPALRSSVIDGTIPAEKFITLTAEEMASEELKAERTALQMQNLFNAKGAEAQEAETDAFECGKCKQRKCRYYQKQTRSADEPMTTFVTCTNCNNKWKFC